MKIILLVIVICYLFKTIKGIPVVFSNKKLRELLAKTKDGIDELKVKNDWDDTYTKSILMIVCWLTYIFHIIMYLMVGLYIKTSIIVTLSAINIVQILLIDISTVNKAISTNWESYGRLYSNKFYRLVNLLINLSFSGLSIYYLLTML